MDPVTFAPIGLIYSPCAPLAGLPVQWFAPNVERVFEARADRRFGGAG